MNKRLEIANLENYDAATRKNLLADCHISDVGLARLVNHLLKKPADQLNFRILTNALDGLYAPTSDFSAALGAHLQKAGYLDMVQNEKDGRYEHSHGAKQIQPRQINWESLDDNDVNEMYGVTERSTCNLS